VGITGHEEGSVTEKRIVLIGSMRYPRKLGQAIVEHVQDGDLFRVPMPESPTNAMIGDWHHWIDWADEVVVVPKPDGSLGAGTLAELRHATGTRKPIIWA
jgi:hypothetical protein